MNSVQQVGFAYAVAAANANNTMGKRKRCLRVIFKMKK